MTAYIKCKGNDSYLIATNSKQNFKILSKMEYFLEVNNCFFIYDPRTNLWTATNSDFSYLHIPSIIKNNNYWILLSRKNKIFTNGKKLKRVFPKNTFELTDDQVLELVKFTANENLKYKDLYNKVKERLNLPDYILPD